MLKRHLVELSAGDYLFRQGEKGNTLYILLKGRIQLSHRIHTTERLVGTLGEGEVVGEKAMLGEGPYRRAFSAIAMTETTLLEFGAEEFKSLQAKHPDFLGKMLNVVIRRLDRANFLVSVLQLPDPVDRTVEYLFYLHQHQGIREASGVRVTVNTQELASGANVPVAVAEDCVKALLKKDILRKTPDGFLISDENALLEYLPFLKERTAA